MTASAPPDDDPRRALAAVIHGLQLSDLQKRFLVARWLDQVIWMEGRANQARRNHQRLRLATIVGGVLVPALVSLDMGAGAGASGVAVAAGVIRWITFTLSAVVALTTSTDEFFRFGDKWRHYRRAVESLKSEGWAFFELGGPYAASASHAEAFRTFVARVELQLQEDVDVYVKTVAQDEPQRGAETATPGPGGEGAPPAPVVLPMPEPAAAPGGRG